MMLFSKIKLFLIKAIDKSSPLILSDKLYLKIIWKLKFNKILNIIEPKSFSEKLQWLKLYDRRKILTTMVDKYSAKTYIEEKVGQKYIIPTLGVWDNVEDMDWETLPDKFVLKTTHDSGGLVICKDKLHFDFQNAKRILKKSLRNNYYLHSREWPYKNASRKIIAEEYLGENLQDYRIYCFNGNPKLIYSYTNVSQTDGSKPEPSYCDIFDINWNPMPFRQKFAPKGNIKKPVHLDEMLDCSKKLSSEVAHVRVDFFETEKVLVGELTLFAGSGMSKFLPEKWDFIIGEWLKLPVK